MATNLTELLSLSKTQRNRLTKEQILDLLDKTDNTGDNHSLVASIATLTSEISQMRQELTEGNKEKDKKITVLEEKVSKLNETVIKQQLYLENNGGCNIFLNIKDRKVYKDGAVIDQWSMQSF